MESQADADLRTATLFNTSNVALARSQKILQSWLPSPAATSTSTQPNPQEPTTTSDPDFSELTDLAGLGSLASKSSSLDPLEKASVHNKLSANDRLREQIMGKKAANRHKQSTAMTAGKSMSAAKHAAPKPVGGAEVGTRGKGKEESSDDEGEGRAGSFRSKKAKARKVPAEATEQNDVDVEVGAQIGGDDEPEGAARKQSTPPVASSASAIPHTNDRPAKRKGGSYLDELLAEKSRKKNKKKKKATAET